MALQRMNFAALFLACAIAVLPGCGGDSNSGSGGGGGITGVYTSVDVDEVTAEFKSGGTVVFTMGKDQGKPGKYTVEGEKIIVDFDGQKTTFIKDGDCIEDLQHMFGKMCKGGAKGAAKNVSTRTPPPVTGTWVATNEDGEFKIDFQPGDKFTFTMTPAPNSQMGDKMFTKPGKFEIEGDTMYTTLDDGTPMVLKWVNGAYESSAFGIPMKFTKK